MYRKLANTVVLQCRRYFFIVKPRDKVSETIPYYLANFKNDYFVQVNLNQANFYSFQIFSICAFATISGYSGFITFLCDIKNSKIEYSYPFYITENVTLTVNNQTCTATVSNDFSSDAKFFVATGVLSMLYAIGIIIVYAKMDEAYKTNKRLPLYVRIYDNNLSHYYIQ